MICHASTLQHGLWDVAFTFFIDLPSSMETSFISNSAGADLCSFVQWLAKLGKLSAILSAVSLVELLLRGATLNVNEPHLVNANRTCGWILKQSLGLCSSLSPVLQNLTILQSRIL